MSFEYKFILIVNPNLLAEHDPTNIQTHGELKYILAKTIRKVGQWDDDYVSNPLFPDCIELIEYQVCDKSGKVISDIKYTITEEKQDFEGDKITNWLDDFFGHGEQKYGTNELKIYAMKGYKVDDEYAVHSAIVMAHSEAEARLILSEKFPGGLTTFVHGGSVKYPHYWFSREYTTLEHIGTALESMSPGVFTHEYNPEWV